MNDQIALVVGGACWAIVVAVWIAGALYNARYAPEERIRPESRSVTLDAATFLVCSGILFLGRDVVEHRTRGRRRSPAPHGGPVRGDAASHLYGSAGDDRRHSASCRARSGDPCRRGRPDRVLGEDPPGGAAPPGDLSGGVSGVPPAGAATHPGPRHAAPPPDPRTTRASTHARSLPPAMESHDASGRPGRRGRAP